MRLRRIGVLFAKEWRQGSTNFLFVYSIVMPILLSFIVTLVFGDLFAQSPRLGIFDQGRSEISAQLQAEPAIRTTLYTSEAELRENVERGVVELGMVLPAGLDEAIRSGDPTEIGSMRWGEALLKNLVIMESAIAEAFIDVVGAEMPIELESVQLGSANVTSWSDRMLPLLIIMAVILGGTVVPASLLVEEKQKRTLTALTSTPATLGEVYTAKALLGILLSTIMGVLVLLINRAFGGQPALLVTVLALSALAASLFGVILGSLVRDIESLLAVIKAAGIVLFAPGLLELIPRAPAWIAQLFPTYYMMNPVLAISQRGAGLSEVAGDLAILLLFVGAMVLLLAFVIERQRKAIALAH